MEMAQLDLTRMALQVRLSAQTSPASTSLREPCAIPLCEFPPPAPPHPADTPSSDAGCAGSRP